MMDTAHLFAKRSYCERKQVGAVLSINGRIIATGYNGTLPNQSNVCECSDGSTSEFVMHAEQNILTFCNREGIKTDNSNMYITLSPCKMCAKLIASAGIKQVFYSEKYRDSGGIDFLKKIGINVEQIK